MNHMVHFTRFFVVHSDRFFINNLTDLSALTDLIGFIISSLYGAGSFHELHVF